MAVDPKQKLDHETAERTEPTGELRNIYLREGRTLTIASEGRDELVEIRGSSGVIELRIKLTDEGPILQMEAVKLALRATESIELSARNVTVTADETLALASHGDVHVTAEDETKVESGGEVRVTGKMIHLN